METVERYIRDLEAIKNYNKVVEEREELLRKVAVLEANLKSTCDELARYKEIKVHLPEGGEVSLAGARQDFLRARDAEIEKRATQRFETLKREYEIKMPQMVHQRLIQVVKDRAWPAEIAAVVRAEAEERVDRILYEKEKWPNRFKGYYQKEVGAGIKSGLDSEFEKRVKENADAKAQARLSELVNQAWPVWFAQNTEPRVAELERKANENAVQLLRGPWAFTCDRCGVNCSAELAPFGIEQLLRKGRVEIDCVNPACEDVSFFSRRGNRFQVSLHELIEVCIGRES